MAKVKVKRNVKAASFELLTDFTPVRKCTGCGLMHTEMKETPFSVCEDGGWKPFEITDFHFCPRCGKPLKTPKDLMPGYVTEWAED